jgi:hypothetical protein
MLHEKINLEEAIGIEKHDADGENGQNLFEFLQVIS